MKRPLAGIKLIYGQITGGKKYPPLREEKTEDNSTPGQ